MMKPVQCPICGVAHWGAAHVWPQSSAPPPKIDIPFGRPAVNKKPPPPAVEKVAPAAPTPRPAPSAQATAAPGPKRDRAAYMRQRRAKLATVDG